MDKKELHKLLQEFGMALAENKMPLTFFVGGEVEFDRVDVLNDTEPGKALKKYLEELTAVALDVPIERVDELLITYYLMMNTSVLVEHTGHSVSTGVYQPSIDRNVFTLDEDEIKLLYKLHGIEVPEKATKDLDKAITGVMGAFESYKIKGLRLDWSKAKTTNPRSLVDYDDGVHIIPVDVLVGYLNKMEDLASNHILKITYKRVNTSNRVQYVTLNKDAINKVYSEDLRFADDFFERSTPKRMSYHGMQTHVSVLSGFWKVGDLGLSRFVYNPSRHVSLSRITDISLAVKKDLDEILKYVNVDIDGVLDNFIHHVGYMSDEQKDKVMDDLNCTTTDLVQFVQAQVTIFSTTYLKSLHDYMVINQDMFRGYTGIKKHNFEQPVGLDNNSIKFGAVEELDF